MREHIHRFRVVYQEARNASEPPQANLPIPVIAAASETG
jgi:hypothetical protein